MRRIQTHILLIVIVVCLATTTFGCGNSSIAGTYKLYTPPWGSLSGSVYELVPNLKLELKSNCTYEQTTYIVRELPESQDVMKFVEKSYKGSYTVKEDRSGQPSLVILGDQPADSKTYRVENLGLVNTMGLWSKEPPPGTE